MCKFSAIKMSFLPISLFPNYIIGVCAKQVMLWKRAKFLNLLEGLFSIKV
jgi:hypothetical protein